MSDARHIMMMGVCIMMMVRKSRGIYGKWAANFANYANERLQFARHPAETKVLLALRWPTATLILQGGVSADPIWTFSLAVSLPLCRI